MKQKITTSPTPGAKSGTSEDEPDDNGAIIDVSSDGEARIREDREKGPAQPDPPPSPAVDDEDPDKSPMDRRRQSDADRSGLGMTRRGPDGRVHETRDETSELDERIDKEFDDEKRDAAPSTVPPRGAPD